ncbi:hypothetical protein [Azospirillum halopraeferens]|uniref:hypothetical protein n=1 Tax=Azospirillum halopraeferens TaxID=34010 RepID=UPI00040E0ABE|nr:hypothetical protein [Azospirillum halopraeferens]
MIIVRKDGLSPSGAEKVRHPEARSSGAPINVKAAAREAKAFLAEQPTLLSDTATLLNESPNGEDEPH